MRGSPYVFTDFRSGVNIEASPYSIAGGQARSVLNVHSTPTGSIKKRNGCQKITSTPLVNYTSLFSCQLSTDVLLAAGGTSLYKVTTGGTVSTLKTGLSNEANWEWIQAPISGGQGPIFGVNGINTPQYWDGSSGETKNWVATKGSVPNGQFIIYHDNRVYIAKGSELFWSDIIDPLNWESPNGGSTKIDPEDGQEITGLGKVGPYLIIFKQRKTFLLTDSNTGGYRRISDDMGCISNRSIASTEAGLFFLTADNEIVVTDGQNFERAISEPIKPLLRDLSGSMAPKSCGVHVGGYYYFSFSREGGVNDSILEYDLSNGAWWIHKIAYTSEIEAGVNQFALLDPSNVSTLFAVGSKQLEPFAQSSIFKCFVSGKFVDSDEIPYPTYWVSPWHVFTYPHIRKRVREIRVDALGSYELFTNRSFNTSYIKEEVKNWEISDEGGTFGGEGLFGGEGTFGGSPSIVEKRFYTPGVGRAWSLKFESKTNQDLEIYAYTIAVDYKKD
jgi:hypothetical protein